eukprot:CAMPEP_0172392606 /NCGR_PEP_ID=MMETSP1061-20121228/8689_1 /TAXON_ID=37318 /ORGANISM="Pseudo-nitzschia pungens, Strain cf. pungens" /LENGTH=795 /DNA_ID=CAMNT_0013123477 /DNA_START=161 /DNA_END=2548 /DNA_ORIENTATION=-
MGDFFANKLWQNEPDFAKDDEDGKGDNADGENENNEIQYGAHHVIALVDCHPDMFEKRKSTTDENYEKVPEAAPVELSIKVIQTFLQLTIEQTVIRKTGKRNGVGLLLYNTACNKTRTVDETNDDDDDDDKMDDEDYGDDEHGIVDGRDEFSAPRAETTVHRLLDLEPPGIKHAKTLQSLLSDDQKKRKADRDLRAEFCPSVRNFDPPIAPLQTALEEAMRMFLNAKCVRDPTKTAKSKNESDSRSIWVFTNQANPYADEKQQLIENIANLAKEQRVKIVVWPLELPFNHKDSSNNYEEVKDNEFNSTFFDSMASEFASKHGQLLRSESDMLDILTDEFENMNKKRRTYYGPMHILRRGKNTKEKDSSIMIDWYSVVQLSRRPGKVQIDKETKRETIKVRYTLEKDTGKDVARFWNKPTIEQREHQRNQPGMRRFRHFFKFANELVPMTQQDMGAIRNNANGDYAPGLTVLGFKSRDAIPFHHSTSKTFVIFPNDTDVQGSRNAFDHLHAAMLRKNVLGVGEVLHNRENSQSRLVAIYPFESTSYLPHGMYVATLPFEDDMRAVAPDAASTEWDLKQEEKKDWIGATFSLQNQPDSIGSNARDGFSDANSQKHMLGNIASEDLIKAAVKLMSRQSLKSFEIGLHFENAALTEFYSYLKSVVFNTVKEEMDYDTTIDPELVLEIARKEIETFKSFLPIDVEQEATAPSRKRERNKVPDTSGINWEELYRTDDVGSCKMDLLKQYLRSVGLPTSGRKSDLVERVTRSIEMKSTTGDRGCIINDPCMIKKEEQILGMI